MGRLPRFALYLVLPLALLAPRAAVPADEPPRLKTQVIKLNLADDQPQPDRPPAVELVELPAGKVTVKGPDGKDHEQTIRSIWIAKYETRWDEYDVFWLGLDVAKGERPAFYEALGKTRPRRPAMYPYGGYDPDEHQEWESPGRVGFPANCIHFWAAQRYGEWLSKNTGRKFRLPTEAEWEYACRAGGPPFKPDAKALDAIAWFADNAKDKTHAVGTKQPNAWGLYDMFGNVGEFVIRDPKDEKGLLAGGSYKDDAKDVHSGVREPYSPNWQRNDPEDPRDTSWLFWSVHHVGFRVVMEE